MDPMSPPLPLTASTRTGLLVKGSASSILELVLPPPKFVIRRSAPRRLDRYRSRRSSLPCNCFASRSSQRSFRYVISVVSGINHLSVMLEAIGFFAPLVGVLWLENLYGKRPLDNRSHFLQRIGLSGGKDLDRSIPQSCRLRRAGENSLTSGICGELIQKAILASSSDDADLMNLLARYELQFLHDLSILHGQALQNGSCIPGRALRQRLMGSRTKFVNGCTHVAGSQKRFIVGINEMAKCWFFGGQIDQLRVVTCFPCSRPLLAATPKHPQSHHIFQEACCAFDSTFIAKVQAESIIR